MQPTTLKQFQMWVQTIRSSTWYLPMFGKDEHIPIWKYIDIGFDTRTETVYRIVVRGSTPQAEICAHTGDMHDEKYKDCESLIEIIDRKIAEHEKLNYRRSR